MAVNLANEDNGGIYTIHKTPCKPLQELKERVQNNEKLASKRRKEGYGRLIKLEKDVVGLTHEFRMFVLITQGKDVHDQMQMHKNPGLDGELKRQQIMNEMEKFKNEKIKGAIYKLLKKLLIAILLILGGAGSIIYYLGMG